MRVLLFASVLCLSLAAQEPGFEVASVKPSHAAGTGSGIHNTPGGLQTRNTSLQELIRYALGAHDFQILGGPSWIRDERFDIDASNDRAEDVILSPSDRKNVEARLARIRGRLRKLLAERFSLDLREEQREVPAYALTVDKAGPKMTPVEVPLGNVTMNSKNGSGAITGKGMTMRRLSDILSGVVERPVTDETGLTDPYDIELRCSLDLAAPDPAGVSKEPAQPFPSLFTAIREQLGLRLTPKKGTAPVWIVVRAEKPGEN